MPMEIQQTLLNKLAKLRRTIQSRLAMEAVGRLILALAALVAITFAFDYTMHLDRLQRGVFLAAGLTAAGWVVLRRLIRPLCVSMDEESLALLVESRYPSLGDRLISALQFRNREAALAAGMSGSMIDVVVAQANDFAGQLEFGKIVEKRALRKIWTWTIVVAILLGGATVARGDLMGLWFQRNVLLQNIDWPQDVYLNVYWVDKDGNAQPLRQVNAIGDETLHENNKADVLRGGDLKILVFTSTATNPDGVELNVAYPSAGEMTDFVSPVDDEQAARWRKQLNIPAATEVYLAMIPTVTEQVEFFATGGDDRLDARRPHHVNLIEPPTLEDVRFVIETPAYLNSKRSDEIEGSRGVLSLPVGSTLHIRAKANKELKSVGIVLDGKAVGNCVLDESAKTIRGSVRITGKNISRALGLKFRLVDRAGYTNRRMEEYTLKVDADLPPQFRYFRTKGVSQEVCPTARIPLHASAMDAYGVGEIRSWYTITAPAKEGKPSEPSKPIQIGLSSPAQPQSIFTAKWELDIKADPAKGEKPLPVGTVIAMQAECSDMLPKEFAGPNRSKSVVLELRVISREELLGRLAARQKETQLEFREQAIVQQNASLGKMEIIADNARNNDIAAAKVDLEEALGRQRISMTES